jgi:hypothetical protein
MRRGRRNDIFDQPWVPIAAVIGVIAVIAIAAFFFLGSGGSSNQPAATVTPTPTSGSSSSPSTTIKPTTTINAATTIKEIPIANVPSTGVFVRVNYIGSYSGTYGANDEITTISDSSDKVFEVFNATGSTVKATFRKTDSSTKSHDLTVEIWKDGKVLKTATDAAPKAEVSVAYQV